MFSAGKPCRYLETANCLRRCSDDNGDDRSWPRNNLIAITQCRVVLWYICHRSCVREGPSAPKSVKISQNAGRVLRAQVLVCTLHYVNHNPPHQHNRILAVNPPSLIHCKRLVAVNNICCKAGGLDRTYISTQLCSQPTTKGLR